MVAQQAVEEDDEIQEYVPVKSEPAAQQQEMYEDPSQGAAAGGWCQKKKSVPKILEQSIKVDTIVPRRDDDDYRGQYAV